QQNNETTPPQPEQHPSNLNNTFTSCKQQARARRGTVSHHFPTSIKRVVKLIPSRTEDLVKPSINHEGLRHGAYLVYMSHVISHGSCLIRCRVILELMCSPLKAKNRRTPNSPPKEQLRTTKNNREQPREQPRTDKNNREQPREQPRTDKNNREQPRTAKRTTTNRQEQPRTTENSQENNHEQTRTTKNNREQPREQPRTDKNNREQPRTAKNSQASTRASPAHHLHNTGVPSSFPASAKFGD
ncbi:TRIO and F-actin-binding protein-like, partial [Penaeus japonicus]|uniref:TRIO and F-actin-binding protein-like n=1 Tax=Penaeus japonicus TaxID=27405 RepID=UPI001C7155BE